MRGVDYYDDTHPSCCLRRISITYPSFTLPIFLRKSLLDYKLCELLIHFFLLYAVAIGGYTELIASYKARVERLDFILEGHELTGAYPIEPLCPICNQPIPESLQEKLTQPHVNERQQLMNRLEDLQDVLRHIDTERNQLREDEDIVKTKLQKISNAITSNLTPQFDNLHKGITSHKSLLNLFAERDQLSKLIEETSQEVKIKT